MTPTIILLSVVTWIPRNAKDDTEKNGFISPDFVKSFISNLFGSLQKMKIPQVESDIDLEVVNSYTTDLSSIHNIITVDDKSTWVNDYNKQVIRQINIDNGTSNTTLCLSVCVCVCVFVYLFKLIQYLTIIM